MGHRGEGASSILSAIDSTDQLEAVLLFKQTGTLIAGWTRNAVPQEVVTVMAATMFGAVETLLEAIGGSSPSVVVLETGDRRMLAAKMNSQEELLLVAPKSASEASLRHIAKKILRNEASRESNTRGPRAGILTKP